MSNTLIETLRLRTRGLHSSAERAMNIMAPDLTVNAYVRKLTQMYFLYTSIAPFLDAKWTFIRRGLSVT